MFNNTGKLFSLKKIPNYVKPTPFLNHTALDYCSFYKTVMQQLMKVEFGFGFEFDKNVKFLLNIKNHDPYSVFH